jgi:hypothetical protein
MTAEQAALLKQLALDGYEPDALRPNLTRAEADRRIAMLSASAQTTNQPRARRRGPS